MEITRTSSDPTGKRRTLRAACLVACLIGWSTSGAATTSALEDGTSYLPGLELVTGDYTVEIADLMSSGTESPDVPVPYLYLTPRVATILEDVFGDTNLDVAETIAADDEQDEAPTTAPVADNVERPLSPETPSFDNTAILPRFQRQMYRTDI